MKRVAGIFLLVIWILTGCSQATNDSSAMAAQAEENGASQGQQANAKSAGDIVEISERLFVSQTNDIYLNTADYLGRTIKYEGLFKTIDWEGSLYYYVIRYGPGCCGNDGEVGFEVVWDGEGEWPNEDDWCEVVGVLEEYEENGTKYLRLVLTSLNVLDERGAESVT